MKYRRLTSGGDYTFGRNEQNFITGVDGVAQMIQTRLKLLKGEWWEDIQKGLPLFQNILGQNGTKESRDAVDLLIKNEIMDVQDVIDIQSFDSTYDKRTYSFSCIVNTKYGQTNVEVSF